MEPVPVPPVPDGPEAVMLSGADKVKDFIERVGTTAIEAALAFLIATPIFNNGHVDLDVLDGLIAVVLVAVYNAVLNVIFLWAPKTQNKWWDLAIRCVKTFVSTWAGLFTFTSLNDLNWSSASAAGAAGLTAVLAVIKGWLAERFVDDTITPASLAKTTLVAA